MQVHEVAIVVLTLAVTFNLTIISVMLMDIRDLLEE